MDMIKTDKYSFEPLSTHFSTMFVYENQQERGALKDGFQVYTETGGYLVLGRQKSYEIFCAIISHIINDRKYCIILSNVFIPVAFRKQIFKKHFPYW